jgi:hypothetical protein
MNRLNPDESGVRMKIRDTLSAEALVESCHVILDTASSIAMNLEFLAGAATGSNADREAAVMDARISVMKLSAMVRSLQDAARKTGDRAA